MKITEKSIDFFPNTIFYETNRYNRFFPRKIYHYRFSEVPIWCLTVSRGDDVQTENRPKSMQLQLL